MTNALLDFVGEDQHASSRFYEAVFGEKPALEVPGRTEFRAGDQPILGLMPESGISRLLGFSPEDLATGRIFRLLVI